MTDATGVVSALTGLGKLSTTPWEAAMPSTAATVMVWRLMWFACCSASMPEGYWWPCGTWGLGVAAGTDCVLQAIPAASGMPEGDQWLRHREVLVALRHRDQQDLAGLG